MEKFPSKSNHLQQAEKGGVMRESVSEMSRPNGESGIPELEVKADATNPNKIEIRLGRGWWGTYEYNVSTNSVATLEPMNWAPSRNANYKRDISKVQRDRALSRATRHFRDQIRTHERPKNLDPYLNAFERFLQKRRIWITKSPYTDEALIPLAHEFLEQNRQIGLTDEELIAALRSKRAQKAQDTRAANEKTRPRKELQARRKAWVEQEEAKQIGFNFGSSPE